MKTTSKKPHYEEPHLSQERQCPEGSSPSARWQHLRQWAAAPPPPPHGPPWSGGPLVRPPWASHHRQTLPWPSAGGWGGTERLWEWEGRRCGEVHMDTSSNPLTRNMLWNNCWGSGQARGYSCVLVTYQDPDNQDSQDVACCNKMSNFPQPRLTKHREKSGSKLSNSHLLFYLQWSVHHDVSIWIYCMSLPNLPSRVTS